MAGVGKDGRETCRSVSKDMDFIADTVRAKWASASRIRDMLVRGTEMSVSREGFTLGTKAQEIGRIWVSGEETEIESGDEKVCPKEVRREERDVSRKAAGVSWGGGRAHRAAPESRGGRAEAASIGAQGPVLNMLKKSRYLDILTNKN